MEKSQGETEWDDQPRQRDMEAARQDKAELGPVYPPSLGASCPYGVATVDLTGQAPSKDRNIFTSCLPRPLAWAGEQLPELSH